MSEINHNRANRWIFRLIQRHIMWQIKPNLFLWNPMQDFKKLQGHPGYHSDT